MPSLTRSLCCILLLALPLPASAERPPNVVLLIGDDHGYPYFGFMGDDHVVTPAMDALAEGGVTFTQGHASASYCRPSLRTLITGLHPVQYAQRKQALVERQRRSEADYYASLSERDRLARDQVMEAAALKEFDTLPKLLAARGYASWQGGKWWENSYRNGHFTEGMSQGWDEKSLGDRNLFIAMMGLEGTELARTTMEPLFDFITRRQDQPLFIWYAPQLPHTPFDAPYTFRKFYESKPISESAKDYYSNITWWDDGVSRLMDHFASLGLLESTLFIYISDNGWEQDAQVEYKKDTPNYQHEPEYATGGFGGKGGLYDLSFRSPVIFHWKGRISASLNTASLVRAEDLFPTILDLAGAEIPEGLPGYSLRPLLEGGALDERTEIVGFNDRERTRRNDGSLGSGPRVEDSGYYVRTHDWHYISRNNGVRELYDVQRDTRAKENLAERHPELVAGFEARIEAWKQSMGMVEWTRLD